MRYRGRSMNRRKITILSVAAALVLTVALYASLSLSSRSRRPPDISLPPAPGETSAPAAGENPGVSPPPGAQTPAPTPKPLVRVAVDRDNVQKVVAELRRPAACSYTAAVTLYWENGSATRKRTVAVRNGVLRVDAYDAGGNPEKHAIADADRVYIWLPGSPVYEGARNGQADDSIAQLPTYEDLLTLDPEAISEARYEILDETVPCVFAEAVQPRTKYTARYWISLETGLLVRSEWFAGSKPVYAMLLEDFNAEEPPDALFTLPGGQLINGPATE